MSSEVYVSPAPDLKVLTRDAFSQFSQTFLDTEGELFEPKFEAKWIQIAPPNISGQGNRRALDAVNVSGRSPIIFINGEYRLIDLSRTLPHAGTYQFSVTMNGEAIGDDAVTTFHPVDCPESIVVPTIDGKACACYINFEYEPSSGNCIECPAGKYKDRLMFEASALESMGGKCEPCPLANQEVMRDETGNPICVCQTNFFLSNGKCDDCPSGAICIAGDSEGGVLETKEGYFRITTLVDANKLSLEDGSIYLPCPRPKSCLGGTMSTCEQGYANDSALCMGCASDYARSGLECKPCASTGAVGALAVTILVLGGLFVAKLIHSAIKDMGRKRSPHTVLFKMMLNYFQMLGLVALFPLQWPPAVRRMFSFVEVGSLSGTDLLSIDCLFKSMLSPKVPSTFYIYGVTVAMVPILSILVLASFWAIYARCKKGTKARKYFKLSVIVALFLQHIILVKTGLRFFACVRVYDDYSFLEADTRIQCWTPNHRMWAMGVGAPILLLYGAGIPAYALWKLRKIKRDLEAYRPQYGFLFSSYQDEYYYWEIIISVRKMAFAAVAVLLTPVGSNIAVVCGLLVVYIATTSHAVTNPYHLPGMDRVELAGLVTTFLTMFAGSLLLSPQIMGKTNDAGSSRGIVSSNRKKEQEALSLFIVGINAIYMVYVLYFLYTRVKHNVAHFFTTVKKYRRGSFKSISEARKFYRSGTSTTQTPRSEKVEGAPPVNLRLSTSSGIGLGTPLLEADEATLHLLKQRL